MHISEADKKRMKMVGWVQKRNYFYKSFRKATLVIEYRNDKIFLDVYNNKTLNPIEKRQTYESVTATLSQSLLLEKNRK